VIFPKLFNLWRYFLVFEFSHEANILRRNLFDQVAFSVFFSFKHFIVVASNYRRRLFSIHAPLPSVICCQLSFTSTLLIFCIRLLSSVFSLILVNQLLFLGSLLFCSFILLLNKQELLEYSKSKLGHRHQCFVSVNGNLPCHLGLINFFAQLN
jgi:hypothetical protein